ncbi:hypothetical protein Agabi119p4_6122 [Agaricus bisporus var. burnettii]|uniref:Uncharacterized protein n=1 Tax=Agaricus bisporus var. burnettii TaxID=192524 RepID=A0A8H7KGB0_AGABI|nr:hypothetical protein Agabi119p4_6122 [Agaricus bisporus var. burnettii]
MRLQPFVHPRRTQTGFLRLESQLACHQMAWRASFESLVDPILISGAPTMTWVWRHIAQERFDNSPKGFMISQASVEVTYNFLAEAEVISSERVCTRGNGGCRHR